MKSFKLSLTLLILIGSNARLLSQPKNTSKLFEININGNDGKDSNDCNNCVPYGSVIKFKIGNVNSLKLHGYTTSKSLNIDFDIPAQFSAQDQDFTSIKSTSDAKEKLTDKKNKSSALSLQLNYIIKQQALIEKKVNPAIGKKKGSSLIAIIKKLHDQIADLTDSLIAINKEIDTLNKKIEKLQNAETEKKKFQEGMMCFIRNFQNISLYQAVENYIDTLLTPIIIENVDVLRENSKNYIEAIYGTTNTLDCHKTVYSTLINTNDCYLKLKTSYEALSKLLENDTAVLSGSLSSKAQGIDIEIDNAKMELKYKKYFIEEYQYTTKIIAQLNDPKIRTGIINKADAGIRLFNEVNNSKFEVFTDGDQINSDQMEITPSLKDNSGKVVKEFNKITLRARGGIKVNFSTGYLLSFIGDENYAYYTQSDSVKGITKQAKNQITHAIGALCHVYKRICRDFTISGSAGLSITNDGTVGFYTGLSGLFTEKNRLAFTVGASAIKIKQLNTGNLKDLGNGKYDFLTPSNTSINYDNLYRTSFFIGITYNISKNQ